MQRVLVIPVLLLLCGCWLLPRERSWTAKELSEYRGDTLKLEDSRGNEFTVRLDMMRKMELAVQRLREPIRKIVDVDAEVLIVEDEEPNAFAGYKDEKPVIAITRGMLVMLGNDIDEYAALLSHEMSHWAWGHWESSVLRTIAVTVIRAGLSNVPNPFIGLAADIGVQAIDTMLSRDQEREADDLSIELMMLAGFDPMGAVRLHQKFIKYGASSDWSFLSTHPSGAERIERMRAKIAAGKPKMPSYEVRQTNTN
jgi:Zn-dependent protease with chaperone function